MSSLYENHHDGPTAEPRSEKDVEMSGVELVAILAQQSANDLQFTNDQIQRYWISQAENLAQTLIEVERTLRNATVIDRRTEDRLAWLDYRIASAHDVLDHIRKIEEN